ncbi:hypothetical protein Tco_1387628, partial [Tanacetum coccineum]
METKDTIPSCRRTTDATNARESKRELHESNGTKFEKKDTSSRSVNDADADNADIKPIYNEEPMADVHLTSECI